MSRFDKLDQIHYIDMNMHIGYQFRTGPTGNTIQNKPRIMHTHKQETRNTPTGGRAHNVHGAVPNVLHD